MRKVPEGASAVMWFAEVQHGARGGAFVPFPLAGEG